MGPGGVSSAKKLKSESQTSDQIKEEASQWSRIISLCESNRLGVYQRLQNIYSDWATRLKLDATVILTLRKVLSDWLELYIPQWQAGYCDSDHSFNEFVEELNGVIDRLPVSDDKFVERLTLKQAKECMQSHYQSNTQRFLDDWVNHYTLETVLLSEVDSNNFKMQEPSYMGKAAIEIKNELAALESREIYDLTERKRHIVERLVQSPDRRAAYEFAFNSAQEQVRKLDQTRTAEIQAITAQYNKAKMSYDQSEEELKRSITEFYEKAVNVQQQLSEKLEQVKNNITEYKRLVFLSITGSTQVPVDGVQALEEMCYCWGSSMSQLLDSLHSLKQELQNRQLSQYEAYQKLHVMCLQMVAEHIKRAFIVDRQPQKQVIKVSKKRWASMSVHTLFLGVKSLQNYVLFNNDVVLSMWQQKEMDPDNSKTTVPTEKPAAGTKNAKVKAKDNMASTKASVASAKGRHTDTSQPCELKHNTARPSKPDIKISKLNSETMSLVAYFHDVQFMKINRTEKATKTSLVTDIKYCLVFDTTVKVTELPDLKLQTKSVPLVLTSQTSQECGALGTLLWNAMFQKNKNKLDIESEFTSVSWLEVKEFLFNYWKHHTSKNLPNDQLNYLGYKLCKVETKSVEALEECHVTKESFLKEQMHRCNSSFWKWFYACLNLVKEKLNKEYENDLIVGFMGKLESQQALCEHDDWTFLLRFRESKVIETQCAHVTATPILTLKYTGSVDQPKYMHIDHVRTGHQSSQLHDQGIGFTLTAMETDKPGSSTREPLLINLLKLDNEIVHISEAFNSNSQPEGIDGYFCGIRKIYIRITDSDACPLSPSVCSDLTAGDLMEDEESILSPGSIRSVQTGGYDTPMHLPDMSPAAINVQSPGAINAMSPATANVMSPSVANVMSPSVANVMSPVTTNALSPGASSVMSSDGHTMMSPLNIAGGVMSPGSVALSPSGAHSNFTGVANNNMISPTSQPVNQPTHQPPSYQQLHQQRVIPNGGMMSPPSFTAASPQHPQYQVINLAHQPQHNPAQDILHYSQHHQPSQLHHTQQVYNNQPITTIQDGVPLTTSSASSNLDGEELTSTLDLEQLNSLQSHNQDPMMSTLMEINTSLELPQEVMELAMMGGLENPSLVDQLNSGSEQPPHYLWNQNH